MKGDNDSVPTVSNPGHSTKPRQRRTREVSSRFLSPSSSPSSTTPVLQSGFASPTKGLSPVRSEPRWSSVDSRSHRSLEDPGFSCGQLWPSSSPAVAASSGKKNLGTLADHIGNDRLREYLDRKNDDKSAKTSSNFSLSKQRSCREFKSSQKDGNNSYKENDRQIIGGSMRYTEKIVFPEKSSSSSVKKSISNDSDLLPRRLSIDENALYRKSVSSQRSSDCFTNSIDSESDYSDTYSGTSFNSPTQTSSSRKLGKEISSKYMSHSRRAPRGTSDSNLRNNLSSDDSSMLRKFTMQKVFKRANSLTGYKSSKSQWALSPGRSGSPSMSVESKEIPMSFSSLRPPNSPSNSKVKGVEKFLSMGFDLFRTKKSSSQSSPKGFGNLEVVHQLRLLDNSLIQWRYANARAQAVNENISHQAKSNLISGLEGLTKLRHSVLQKKVQLEREKLQMKLNSILNSQMKLLEAWGGIERQHLSAITLTKESLHSVVCRVPLLDGAEVDIRSVSIAQRHASELTAAIKSVLTSFSHSANKTAALLSEVAEVVAQEKMLLQEFYDLFRTICVLELQERSLRCNLIQLQC